VQLDAFMPSLLAWLARTAEEEVDGGGERSCACVEEREGASGAARWGMNRGERKGQRERLAGNFVSTV
jgi:hypothetical protein